MDVRQVLRDDDAVSPVIGVILMVAITVILAAVIASFVLGFSDDRMNTQPQATFSFDYKQADSDTLTVVHDNGDTIDGGNLNVTSNNALSDAGEDAFVGEDVFTGSIKAGTTETLDNSTFKGDDGSGSNIQYLENHGDTSTDEDDLDLSGATVRVVYTAESGDKSATLGKWEGPDA